MYWCDGVRSFDELAEEILFSGLNRDSIVRLLTSVFEQIMGYGWDRDECKPDTAFAGDPLVEEAYQTALDNRKKR